MHRNRSTYFILLILTILTGLASRYFSGQLPQWVNAYVGDSLWALMVFLILGIIFRKEQSIVIAATTLLFSFAIEFSQFYHAEWIDAIRATWIGGIVLGYGFLWSDLICYTVGVGFGYAMEMIFLKKDEVVSN